MFYSRRIGEFKDIAYNVEIPTYINGAVKLSSKNHQGFSYGLIAANTDNKITANLESEIQDNDDFVNNSDEESKPENKSKSSFSDNLEGPNELESSDDPFDDWPDV